MIESGIRGGFSGVLGSRFAKANNHYLNDYDPKIPSSYLIYLDANNLYGYAMKQKLPYSDFQWLSFVDFKKLVKQDKEGDPKAIEYFKKYGRIWKVDLEYNDDCKVKTWKFPLAPERKTISPNDLNKWQVEFLKTDNEGKPISSKIPKLLCTLNNKKEYVIHERLLNLYISYGLKITKIHKIISFREENWLEHYIDLNTAQRTKATTDFEKNIWKLMNNAFYGKTCENIRNRVDVKLVTDSKTAVRLQTNPFYKSQTIFIDDKLTAIQMGIKKLKFNKPIYTGMSILDLSKFLMYQTFYEDIQKKWPSAEIIGYDTDSFFLYIQTEDIYKDMLTMDNILDTSDYPSVKGLKENYKRQKDKFEKESEILKKIPS
jgi:hypothetical protein